MMCRWEGGDLGVINQKIFIILLLKFDGSFYLFGFGVRDFYYDLELDDVKKWMYFEKFKMVLYINKVQLSLFISFFKFFILFGQD